MQERAVVRRAHAPAHLHGHVEHLGHQLGLGAGGELDGRAHLKVARARREGSGGLGTRGRCADRSQGGATGATHLTARQRRRRDGVEVVRELAVAGVVLVDDLGRAVRAEEAEPSKSGGASMSREGGFEKSREAERGRGESDLVRGVRCGYGRDTRG